MPTRKSRFTESQIVEILKQGEVGSRSPILRQHNISKATYFQWRAAYYRPPRSHLARDADVVTALNDVVTQPPGVLEMFLVRPARGASLEP